MASDVKAIGKKNPNLPFHPAVRAGLRMPRVPQTAVPAVHNALRALFLPGMPAAAAPGRRIVVGAWRVAAVPALPCRTRGRV